MMRLKIIRWTTMMASIVSMVNGAVLCIRAGVLLYSTMFPTVQQFNTKEYWLCMILGSIILLIGILGFDEMMRTEIVAEEEI